MEKPTFCKALIVALFLSLSFQIYSQNFVPFSPRYDEAIKGDMLLIGNSNVGLHVSDPYNGDNTNDRANAAVFVDIDSDPSTFNSSSADLDVPNDVNCYQVVYAGLYWSSVVNGSTPRSEIKFKVPGGSYIDITGTEIYYQNATNNNNSNSFAYYHDVTSIVSSLSNPEGTYTVANISSMVGAKPNSEGLSAGWSLFVIYEDPLLPSKYITSFDGFTKITSSINETIPISGFRTIPTGPVRAKYAFNTIEGDRRWTGDYLLLNGTTVSATNNAGTVIRPGNNFFNSTASIIDPITNTPELHTARTPNGSNTLGFDSGIINVPNAGNTVIANGATDATISLGSNLDIYYFYFNAFAIEIIAPNIVLTKIVEDEFGNDIGGQIVDLGDELNYVIGFQNTGNDDARGIVDGEGLIIRDILPTNIVFNYPADIGLLPPGVTVQSYDATTRELIFEVDESVVEENDPLQEIRFKVTVVSTCSLLNDACSNIINNQAFSTYRGTINPTFIISDDPSYATNTGCLLTPGATNFLADINDCTFEEEVVLCGDDTVLTAGAGYDAYSWSTSPTGTPVIGTTQSITVTTTGTYYVHNTAVAPCQDTDQIFNVITFGANVTNPLIPFADQVVICPNDGKELPNFFLCGANDSRLIQTNITDTTSMIWERLDETSCTAVLNSDCANEDVACTWNQVNTGPDYTIDSAGQYRLTMNYSGGCFNQFYFNVYENLLVPTAMSSDIICTTPGEIIVGGVPSGYEYSIDATNYQPSNIFSITTAGIYTVYIRQVGVSPNPCIFTVPDIQVRERDFNPSVIITQPLCHGELGSVVLAANDVRPQYYFSIYNGATLVNSVGPITNDNYTFSNLTPGTYTINISTDDGCVHSEDIEITEPLLLEATSALTRPITCTDGEITVYPVGGTPPYYYFVNSTTVFQSVPTIDVSAAGTFNITVVDSNNCSADTSITVQATNPPDFNITQTDILCFDAGDAGAININLINANGNTLEYSIDNGVNFVSTSIFTNLAAGDYNVVVRYTISGEVCLTTPQLITINSIPTISGTATLTTPYTCTTNGEITVSSVSGGTAPYAYSIDGVTFQLGNTFAGLTDGTYNVTIRDANSCTTVLAPITIDPLNPPTDLDFSSTLLTCPSLTSNVTLTSTGGLGTLEYQIIAPSASATVYQTSNIFNGLVAGTYTFQVRDASGCLYSESYSILDLPTLNVVGQTISDVSCFGALDGAVRFTVSGTTNFSYTVNGGTPVSGTSPINLTGLSAGTYNIVITDNVTNCTSGASAIVDTPSTTLSITTAVSPITCISSGNVVINTTGGWGGNNYTLTLPDSTVLPVQNSNLFSNLTQTGTYTVSVTDSNGCIANETFNLTTPTIPSAVINNTSDLCYDVTNGASLEVSASGGQPPFEYNINGGAFVTTNVFNNLVPGNYIISVRDSYGCTVTLPSETIANQLAVNTVLTKGLDCTASPDAIITGNISGGYAPFTYAVSINGSAYTSLGLTGTPFTYSTVSSGTYQFQITDAQGCISESGIETINAISNPEITVTQTQFILCNGEANAAIDVNINNTVGTPVFVINVTNTTTGINYGTQTSGLTAGDYTITITDANSCTDVENITITEPDAINVSHSSIPITCGVLGVSKGSVIVNTVSGGTAPYNYYVTGTNGYSAIELNASGTTSTTFDVVDFGLYQINVIDSNGCSVLIQDVLVASPPTDLDITINTISDCITGGEAVVNIGTSLVSTGPFFFDIYRGVVPTAPPGGTWVAEDSPGSQSAIFNNLTPGFTYTFIVFDVSTGCSYYETATAPIPSSSTLTSSALVANNITCTGSADGAVSFSIHSIYGVSTNVNYEIFDSLSLLTTGISGTGVVPVGGTLAINNLGPLPFGNYFVSIEETTGVNSGCGIVTMPFNITESSEELEIIANIDNNANCNPNSGVISAIASRGTPPYLYQLTTSSVAPVATDPSWNTANVFNRDGGNYYAHVIDAYGCIRTTPIQVLDTDPEPTITAILNNQCTASEGDFEIDVTLVTSGIAPHSYSIDGGVFQTRSAPFTVSNLSSGNHSVEVRDANGCGNLVNVMIQSPLDLSAAVTALPNCPDNDGVITVTGTGGTGNYSYTISPSPISISLSSNVFSGVPSGTYIVTITDTTTSCTANETITLSTATPVTFTTTRTPVSCSGGSDGSITVNLPVTNDNPIYTYEIIAPIVVAPQTSNIFTGLPTGNYTVRVNSGRGCSNTENVLIGEPIPLSVSGTTTPYTCALDNSVNTSTLTMNEAGGTAPFTYSIDGVNYFNTNTFDIIDTGSIQNINIFAQDTNGCIATNTVVVNPLVNIISTVVGENTPIDCNGTGSLSITVTGGSGNFSFQMLPSGIPQASNIFNITSPGDYYFQVNDIGTGCYTTTLTYTIAPFDNATVVLTPITSTTCFGDLNGSFEIDITGYSGAYNYEVFDNTGTSINGIVSANTAVNPEIVSGMTGGNYYVQITETDSPFCLSTSNVITISSPSEALTLAVNETSNVSCDNNRGTITAVANGGWGTYEYELTGMATVAYSSNGTFSNLSSGNYTISVRDAGGCIVSENITLDIPTPINASVVANVTNLSCFGDNNGTITVSAVTGGQGSNYIYTLNMVFPITTSSGPQSSPIFNNLVAGTYTVTITDGYNCSFNSPDVVIMEPNEVEVTLVKAISETCITDASLTLSAIGGTGNYEYSDNPAFTGVIAFTGSVTFPVTDGTYQYYVRDTNGCIASVSNEITIEPIPVLTLNLDETNATIKCEGDSTGIITAKAQGGQGGYTYILIDGSGNDLPTATQPSPGVFIDLPAGNYQVRVESGNCPPVIENATVVAPNLGMEVTFNPINVTCNGENDGMLEINVTPGTGTGIIKYSISPRLDQFFDVDTVEDLSPGVYQVVVQDELGCFETFDFDITEPDLLGIISHTIINEAPCDDDITGSFSIEIIGGEPPYSVSLDNITYISLGAGITTHTFTGLSGGEKMVYIIDSSNCGGDSPFLIPFPESVTLNPLVDVDYGCTNDIANNTNTVTNMVTVTVDDNITDTSGLQYSLDGGPFALGNGVFENLSVGSHIIEVLHPNGCIKMTDGGLAFTIDPFEPLAITLSTGGLNEIVAEVNGGSAPYTYQLNGQDYGSTNTFLFYESGDYTVTVTDRNGCIAQATMYFEFVDVCIQNYFVPKNGGWGPGCTTQYTNLTYDIFDRYGRRVAHLAYGQKWDGKYNGIELPTGDYWYIVKLNDENYDREIVGNFTLYR